MSTIRPRDDDDAAHAPSPKRIKLDDDTETAIAVEAASSSTNVAAPEEKQPESLLPPSHSLLHAPAPVYTPDGSMQRIMETDVGISEYISHDVPKIQGIIKQRFTDFLVFEVDLDGNVIHIKSLGMPESSPKKTAKQEPEEKVESAPAETETPVATDNNVPKEDDSASTTAILDPQSEDFPISHLRTQPAETEVEKQASDETEPWPARFSAALQPLLSEDVITRVKELYLEGPEPPFVSDSGWGGRQAKPVGNQDIETSTSTPDTSQVEPEKPEKGKGGRGRGRGRGGKRGGRGGRGGRAGGREDNRRVLSDPISSKETRTELHRVFRELFGGKLETETDTTAPSSDDGSRVVIKWARSGGGRGGRGGRADRGGRTDRGERNTYPPYIHFTLQKTNRDTQDALAHLSRSVHCNVKDLSVAGTKDKRGVTVQRVSLRRGNKTVEDVWKLANGINGRRTVEEALTMRGERGIRVADLNYRKASLELGMLKGNAFVITLRNVQVDSLETLDRAMNAIKTKGFINYYGMQRFGTASIPTHTIGLALLRSEWHRAVSLILRPRPGEHPDVLAARNAWLINSDLDKAIELMPRRVVAERCILESFKKQGGDTRNAMGALSTIPRNLRLMYVHAYQSYVWNAIVSERIHLYGAEKPVVGDLVFDTDKPGEASLDEDTEMAIEGVDGDLVVAEHKAVPEGDSEENGDLASGKPSKRSRKPWEPPKVKTLTEADVDKYSIFDVIMPLPGRDVAFPGGSLGARYREFLKADGLDPDNFTRKQKEYSLNGSYRKILHLPKELSWSVLKYTDPDVALAQADEDKLLGFDPPVIDENGKFLALQIRLTLGTAAYATMALREVTKTETSSHYQSGLTQVSEDQKYKNSGEAGDNSL